MKVTGSYTFDAPQERAWAAIYDLKSLYSGRVPDCAVTIGKSNAKKGLLSVLDCPEIPLHNNEAELAARQQKPKQILALAPEPNQGPRFGTPA